MGTITPLDQIKRFEVTCVYDNPEATVDIVLVHGLNGHPRQTWTAKNGVFWPSQLLPQSLRGAKARVLVYGYNADVYTFGNDKSASSDMIHQHAQSLLTALSMERMSEDMQENSIIWVCHSLGGILVKRALELSNDLTNKSAGPSRSIYVSTYGIIFLGTPHLGADGAKWGHIFETLLSSVLPKKAVDTEDQLLKTLKSNNETLQNINLHFLDIYQRFEIDMVHETVKTDLKGKKSFIVDQTSAGPPLPGVRYYGIEATHSGMCKFEGKNSPGYLNVSMAIKGWVADCMPRIEARWAAERKARAIAKQNEAMELLGIFNQENLMPSTLASSTRTPQVVTGVSTPALSNSVVLSKSAVQSIVAIDPEASVDVLAPTSHFIKPPGFRPNSLFVGREAELELLHKYLFDEKKRSEGVAAVLLQSIPGGGKTHLARQYVYKHFKDFPGGVFWVTAKSMEQLKAGFWRIAETVALKPSQIGNLPKNPDDFVQCVHDWFTAHHDWLLVLDGIRFNHHEEFRPYIPDSKNSSLLYTSTETNVAGDHHFMNPTVMKLPLLSIKEAQDLFFLELGRKHPNADEVFEAKKLVERMGRLPEVIHVAAKQLRETGEPLAKFARAYSQGPKLRALDAFVAVRDQLIDTDAIEALNLIQILSYFSGNIPVEMISLGLKAVDIPLKATDPVTGRNLNNTFKILNRYALIQRNEPELTSSMSSKASSRSSLLADDLDVIRIHTTLRDFFTDYIRSMDQTPQWLGRSISLFTKSYTAACERIKNKQTSGLVSDFRAYEIQAVQLLGHLDKLEKKGPIIPFSRHQLQAALRDIRDQIVLRTRQSSIDISTGQMGNLTSIFDRTSSSSDTGPETPGPTIHAEYPLAAEMWLHEAPKNDSPVSIKGDMSYEYPPAKFPMMPELGIEDDNGYDTDTSDQGVLCRSVHSYRLSDRQPSNQSTVPSCPNIGGGSSHWAGEDRPKLRTPDHRTIRAMRRDRYHDRAGAFRAVAKKPLRPDMVDTHVSGQIHSVNSLTQGSWMPPLPFLRPLSSDGKEAVTTGTSAAEVALLKINKNSPPPGRGGGMIHDRGRRPTTSERAHHSDHLLRTHKHKRTGSYSKPVADSTTTNAFGSSPLAMSTSLDGMHQQPVSRPTFPTSARDSLQRIPHFQPLNGKHVAPSLAPSLDEQLPPPPPAPALAGFQISPYPLSDADLQPASLAGSVPTLYHSPPSIHEPQFYPRRTGPLPIETRPHALGRQLSPPALCRSEPGSTLYPHVQGPPYPTKHFHISGYTSQPMSRDVSGQSASVGPASGYSSPPVHSRPPSRSSAGRGESVGRSRGLTAPRVPCRPIPGRRRAVSVAETEPPPSIPGFSPKGQTSYKIYQSEARYHSKESERAFGENCTVGVGDQFSGHGLGIEEDSEEGDGFGIAIFEPRTPKGGMPRGVMGVVSAPQSPVWGKGGFGGRSRASTLERKPSGLREVKTLGKENDNGNAVGLGIGVGSTEGAEGIERTGSGGVVVGGSLVEFGTDDYILR